MPKEAAHKATWALPNSSVLVDPMCSDFAEKCKIKGTMRLQIAWKRTLGGSVLLAAELSKPVADKQSQFVGAGMRGLISYGTSVTEAYCQAGMDVSKVQRVRNRGVPLRRAALL
jgi:hypothetical protein